MRRLNFVKQSAETKGLPARAAQHRHRYGRPRSAERAIGGHSVHAAHPCANGRNGQPDHSRRHRNHLRRTDRRKVHRQLKPLCRLPASGALFEHGQGDPGLPAGRKTGRRPRTARFPAADRQDTITSLALLAEELSKIRSAGTAVNNEELEKGLFAIAGPIRDHSGEAVAALNVSFPLVRHRIEDALADFVPTIKKACIEISGLLGFTAGPDYKGKSS